MNLPDFLVELPHNEIRVKGHRIGLYHIIYCHREEGFNAEQLQEEYPTLSADVINRVLEFYRQNREEVDRYVLAYKEEIDRQQAAGKHIDLEELRRRMQARERSEVV